MNTTIRSTTPPPALRPLAGRWQRLLAAGALALSTALTPTTAVETTTGDGWIWWEAEEFDGGNVPPADDNPFRPKNQEQRDKLSGGAWVGMGKGRPDTPRLVYDIEVPAGEQYDLYVRKFWKHGPFRWRVGEGEWHEVDSGAVIIDEVDLRKFLSATWFHAGTVALDAGSHRLEIEVLPAKNPAACFDCFVLTSKPFEPRGKLKPDAGYADAPAGWFNFTPDVDPFTDSPIDLRHILNEPRAGDGGFIGRHDGHFVQGDGTEPIRFWGVVSTMKIIDMRQEDLQQLARWLAKHGVNMIRMHGGGLFHTSGENFGAIDEEGLKKIHYAQHVFAEAGIYTLYSIYFQHWVRIGDHPDFPEYKQIKNERPYLIHFYDPQYQALHRDWFEALLSTENPYTGRTMAEDPAVMGIEILNEDNFYFYTWNGKSIPDKRLRPLEARFADWVAQEYGSIQAALDAWGQGHKRDAPMEGRLGLNTAWQMANQRSKRDQATARFFSTVERGFYTGMHDYLEQDLGFKGVICGSNMKTASGRYLTPIERYNNTTLDWMDQHGYFGSNHKRTGPGYGMNEGDKFDDRSALLFDPKEDTDEREFELPFLASTFNNLPTISSEWAWNQPNAYRAEAMLMAPALAALADVDGLCHFNVSTKPGWATNATGYWALHTPADIGQYPAAALLYRLGLVQVGEPAVRMQLNIDDMFALEGLPLSAPNEKDMNRAEQAGGAEAAESLIDPRVYAIGPVHVDFVTDAPTTTETVDLSQYIDDQTGIMTSITGEIRWDFHDGLFTLDAPAAQAACGFLAQHGPIELGDVRIESDLPYVNIMVVAIDGEPLASSQRMLLQVMSTQQNSGFSAPGSGYRTIESVGGSPIIVQELSGSVGLTTPDAARLTVTPLDWNGLPIDGAGFTGADAIDLQPDVLYYVIER